MKRCRLIPATILGLTLTTSVLAQQPSPFAPPATLMAPVPASPAQQIFADPQPPPYPYAQPFRPPQPIQPGGPYQPRQADQCEGLLVGLQLGLVRPSLGGYIAAGPLNVAVPVSVLLGWQFPTGRAFLFEYLYFGANADRTTQFPNDPGPVVTHRHIEGNVFDFDFRFLEGGWTLLKSQTELGIRAANLSYFAFRPSQNYPSLVSNRFEGFGPHLDYKIAVTVFDTGLEFFARSDVGLLFGRNRGFSQVRDPPFVGPFVDWPHTASVRTVGTGRFQLGSSYWFHVGYSRVTLTGGYEFDGYFFPRAGERVGSGGGPLGLFPFRYEPGYVSLANKGPFVRMEIKY